MIKYRKCAFVFVAGLGMCSLAACGSSGSDGGSASGGGGGSSTTAISGSGSSTTSAPPDDKPLGGRDACDLLTTDDVANAFGSTVTAGPKDSAYQCNYVLSGTTKFGDLADGSMSQLSVSGSWPGSLEELDDGVKGKPIDGIGEQGWVFASDDFVEISFIRGSNEVTVHSEVQVPTMSASQPAVEALAKQVDAGL